MPPLLISTILGSGRWSPPSKKCNCTPTSLWTSSGPYLIWPCGTAPSRPIYFSYLGKSRVGEFYLSQSVNMALRAEQFLSSLVSRVEPLLYRHVYICGLLRLGRFYRTFREWRMHGRNIDPSEGTQPSPLEVQTLTLGCYGRSELTSTVHAMLCEMTNLYHLDFWSVGNYTPFIFSPYRPWGTMSSNDAYPFESLRHLSLDSQCLGSSITFKHRAFRDITHMDMYFNERTPWESLRHAQALTHLTLDMIYYRSPPFSTPELESWVTILVKACPPNVQMFVLGCIDKHNEDFDLVDFRRSDSGADDGRMPSSAVSRSKDYRRIRADNLHFLSRLALGKVDPRVVVGSATVLHKDHTFQNNVVYFTYREPPVGQWGSRCFGHVENCWYEAGRVIEGRIV